MFAFHALRSRLALVASLIVVGAGSASAQTYFLNFDTTFAGNPIGSYGAPYGPLVSDAYTIPGVTFTSNDYIYPAAAGGTLTGPNFASGLGDLAPFEIDFTTPQYSVSAFNITNSEYTLTAYDASGNVLSSVVTSNDFEQTTLIGDHNISKVIFTATNTAGYGFGYGFDNLLITSVPEPGNVALLLGFAVTGSSLLVRRKRRA